MNILVIGGKGFLGRNIVSKLAQNNDVFVIDCIQSSDKNYFNVKLEDVDSVIDVIESNDIQIVVH